MAYLPKYIDQYPNMNTAFPLDFTINQMSNGFPAHRHDYLELSYVIEGEGSETINGKTHPLKPGTLSFIQPFQIHELHTEPGHLLRLYNLRFSHGLFADVELRTELQRLLVHADASHVAAHRYEGDTADAMKQSFDALYEEYKGEQPWRQLKLKVMLIDILIRFDRSRSAAETPSSQANAAAGGNALYLDIIRYIQHHYKEELTLDAVARHFHMTPTYISALFSKKTGRSFLQYVHDVRIGHACGLLASTDMKVADVALESGYGSYNTFSRIFREQTGLTPSEYRNMGSMQPNV